MCFACRQLICFIQFTVNALPVQSRRSRARESEADFMSPVTACDLRCSYCDTAYAFTEGKKKPLVDILGKVRELAVPFSNSKFKVKNSKLPLVELTGGEPLLQKNSLPLMKTLCDEGLTVLIETGGAHDISKIDPRVRRIMDLKCPSSGEVERNLFFQHQSFEIRRRNQVRHRHS